MILSLLMLLACPECQQLRGTEACPFDECANTCSSPDEIVACCTERHGFGVTELQRAQIADYCADGAHPCDPDTFVSADAAICIAQAGGLPPGQSSCQAALWPSGDRAEWLVISERESFCPEGGGYGESVEDGLWVDAATGVLQESGSTLYNTLDCPSTPGD